MVIAVLKINILCYLFIIVGTLSFLNGRAPNCLLNHVIPVSAIVSRQRLRSAQQNTLVVPRYRLTTYGRRAFSVAFSICQQSYLLLFGIPSPTHSFFPGLKPSFSPNPSHCSPSFLLLKYLLRGFPGLFTVISEHICFLLLVFSSVFLHFSVVGSVR